MRYRITETERGVEPSRMSRAAALALALLATPAGATILPPWVMGGNPCHGTCSPGWAVREIRAGMGESYGDRIALAMLSPGIPGTIPEGAVIHAMSEGGPRMIVRPMVVPADTPATVWRLNGGWTWAYFGGAGQCANWAMIWTGEDDADAVSLVLLRPALWLVHGRDAAAVYPGTPLSAGVVGSAAYWRVGISERLTAISEISISELGGAIPEIRPPGGSDDTVTPIPLPQSVWALLCGLAGLAYIGKRKR